MKIVEFIKSIISILRDEEHLWLITILATGAVTLVKIVDYFVKDGQSKADNLHTNFNATLNGLKSSNETERITSAILLRRYINDIGFFKKATRYKKDTLNVISSMLRITSCGELQKALADSLSFTIDASHQDFQYINLQNAIIKVANKRRINLSSSDFFRADLSYASINNAKCIDTIFCECNMRQTRFRNCDLRNCNFRSSNLKDVKFTDGSEKQLEGAQFAGATNIPPEILEHLDKEGIYHNIPPTEKYSPKKEAKSVFISCLGNLSPRQTEYIDALVRKLNSMHLEPILLSRDKYRKSGQISVIQSNIDRADGVIIVGLKNMLIKEGEYRPSSSDKIKLKDKWLPTAWNHIEAGIACALGKPTLIIHQAELTDGVFDKSINDCKITHIDAQITSDEFLRKLHQWKQHNLQ